METRDLLKLVRDFFGNKAKKIYIDSHKREVTCTLYDSFVFVCGFSDRYEQFGGGIHIGENLVITDFLGERLSLNGDKKSITKSFEIVDNYCCLRLPDKFLNAYFEAYR
jgi:hypothetical protein